MTCLDVAERAQAREGEVGQPVEYQPDGEPVE